MHELTNREKQCILDKLWQARKPEFENLREHLIQNPDKGKEHVFCKIIFPAIELMERMTIGPDDTWFRGRSCAIQEAPRTNDFKPSSECGSHAGRFHRQGESAWYLSSTEKGASEETRTEPIGEIWIQRINIIEARNILEIRPLITTDSNDILMILIALNYSGVLANKTENRNNNNKEYITTHFIADCARECGFQGIIFQSSKHWSDNLVLFDPVNTTCVDYQLIDQPYTIDK